MHLELIKEFQVFALGQNLSKAARTLCMTQSCLSKHVAELESETGLALLHHGQRTVSLTPVGEYFLQETSCLLASWEEIIGHCKEMQKQGEGSLCVQSLLENNNTNIKMIKYVMLYKRQHPNLEVSFHKLVNLSPLDALERHALDIALDIRSSDDASYDDTEETEGLRSIPLLTEPLIVWFKKDSEYTAIQKWTLETFRKVPILMSVSENYDYVREYLKCIMKRHEIVPYFKPVHFDFDSPASFFLTEFGNAVMVTTYGMLNNPCLTMRDDITFAPIEDPRMETTMYLLAREDNQTACSFFDFVVAQAGEI